MKLIKHQRVGSSMTDSTANLSVMGLFGIAEEAVTELLGEMKTDDITAKREYNAVWVFVKNKTALYHSIGWNEEFTVTCFVSKITKVSLCVDVGITNGTGALCAYTRIELCALDLQSGRIRKVSTVGVDDSATAYPPLTDLSFAKIDAADLPAAEQVRVKYTNIDFAGHTNNKEYVRFMLNTYSVRELEARPVREITVVYINQSHEGDILTVRKRCLPDRDILTVQKEDAVMVKCELRRGRPD